METHVTTECCNCGVLIAMTPDYLQNLKKHKNTFYCPNGHGQSFTTSTEDRLRAELAEKNSRIRILESENVQLKTKKPGRPKKK